MSIETQKEPVSWLLAGALIGYLAPEGGWSIAVGVALAFVVIDAGRRAFDAGYVVGRRDGQSKPDQ